MANQIFQQVSLRDSTESIAATHGEQKLGIKLRDWAPAVYHQLYKDPVKARIHDANFAFVMTTLSKLHNKQYQPKVNYTYAQDIPIDVGGGMVDFVDYFSVEWAGQPTEDQNVMGNNVNIIPRVNAKLNHTAVEVYNFEIAYDMKFIEVDKLEKISFQKAVEAIYKDAIMAGWDQFCDRIAYEGRAGVDGFINNANVPVNEIPAGSKDATKSGFEGMTDEEIVSFINGVLNLYLTNTNQNIEMLPDTLLLPTKDAAILSSRFSALYTATLREFIMKHNIGIDEAVAAGVNNYVLKIRGRARLNGIGIHNTGRIIAYKFDKDYVRMDIPYPIQSYYTAPNIDKACYTTYFVGQVSRIQLPYNESADTFGAVSYWDFAAQG